MLLCHLCSGDPSRFADIQMDPGGLQPGKMAFTAERSRSGRFQNSGFIAGLVRSLASLGKNNHIDLRTLNEQLTTATQARTEPGARSSQFSYSDSPFATQVHSLLLRRFADYPFTAQNSAARRRKELDIDMLRRPFPASASMMEKQRFAASMIADEHESFGNQSTTMSEDEFEQITRDDANRKLGAGDILRGMLIRGRLQAAVFDIFMLLCLQGACSLSSIQHPVQWNERALGDTCLNWIYRMLAVFDCFNTDWHSVQQQWNISPQHRWFDYDTPMHWLAVMIGRSFSSLDVVFDIIRTANQLGPVHNDLLQELAKESQPNVAWKADINLYRPEVWYGSGTFACWLPENVDASIIKQGFDDAALELSKAFFERLERVEMHYAAFFDIEKHVFDSDVQQGERDVRDWVNEEA